MRRKLAWTAAAMLMLTLGGAAFAAGTVVHSKWVGNLLRFYSDTFPNGLMDIDGANGYVAVASPLVIKGGTSGTLPLAVPSAVGTPAALNLPVVGTGDTLVARTTTDTLSHKTFDATNSFSCAGQVALVSGSPSTATVTNSCLTAATNVVLATDCSGSGAGVGIRAVPSNGSLALTGPNTVTDTVCWVRVQ